jgi:hypothetical protein
MQTSRSVSSVIKKNQITLFCLKIYLKYIIIWIFYNFLFFPFPTIRIYSILCPLKKFLAISSPSTVTNITNTHSHSQYLPLLLFYQHPFSYIICSKSEHFHQFPNSQYRRQLTVIIFSDCDRKCSWHINVRNHYWMISVEWRQNLSLYNSFVSHLYRHIYTRLHSWVSTDPVTEFYIGYADLVSWPV